MSEESKVLTYDIHFNDEFNGNFLGFKKDINYCINYIKMHNGTNKSYFEDYKGGTVSIVCNETGKTIYATQIN